MCVQGIGCYKQSYQTGEVQIKVFCQSREKCSLYDERNFLEKKNNKMQTKPNEAPCSIEGSKTFELVIGIFKPTEQDNN